MNADDRLRLFRSLVRDALRAGWSVERDDLAPDERDGVERAVDRVHEADNALGNMGSPTDGDAGEEGR